MLSLAISSGGVAALLHPMTPFDGGPIGPKSTLFLRKYFSSLARMCLP